MSKGFMDPKWHMFWASGRGVLDAIDGGISFYLDVVGACEGRGCQDPWANLSAFFVKLLVSA